MDVAAQQQSPQSGQNQQDVTTEVRYGVLGKTHNTNLFRDLLDITRSLRIKTGLSGFTGVYEDIANDIETRAQFGEKKYGTRLLTNNGRDVILDLYQELLDALMYSKQAELEGKL
jgi:hypothetical protein